jgi:hypothetical protein
MEHFVANNSEVEIIEYDVSYMCDRSDIEVVDDPLSHEGSEIKKIRYKTLTLAKGIKFEVELELNTEDSYLNYDAQPKKIGGVVRFSGDPSSFNCG